MQLHLSGKKLESEAREGDWENISGWYEKNEACRFEVESVSLSYRNHPFWQNQNRLYIPVIFDSPTVSTLLQESDLDRWASAEGWTKTRGTSEHT